jgi:hypothetical protein
LKKGGLFKIGERSNDNKENKILMNEDSNNVDKITKFINCFAGEEYINNEDNTKKYYDGYGGAISLYIDDDINSSDVILFGMFLIYYFFFNILFFSF